MGAAEIVIDLLVSAFQAYNKLSEADRQKVIDHFTEQKTETRADVQSLQDEVKRAEKARDELLAEIEARKKAHADEVAAHEATKTKLTDLVSKIDLAKPVDS